MKNAKLVLAGIICAAAAGCGFFSLKPVPLTSGPVFPLVQSRSLSYGGQVIPPGLKDGAYYYFATDRGQVLAIDVGRRAIAWDFKASHPISLPLSLGRESVYAVDDENIIYRLDRSGWLLWSRGLAETVTGPLAEIEECLYVGTEQGGLYCLQPETGQDIWKFKTKAALRTGALLWKDRQGRPFILCGGDEGRLFFLGSGGRLRGDMDCGAKISVPPLLEGDRLYVGTEGQMFLCLDLSRRRTKWRLRMAGLPARPAVADHKRIFFLTAQGLLVCLNKRSGEILWWRTLSSRCGFDLELADGQVIAASISSGLVSFDARNGEEVGRFQAPGELRSNPAWMNPSLLVHVFDDQKDEGRLIFLRREAKVTLSASKESPQKIGEEITVTAGATGFRAPSFQFRLRSRAGENVVQDTSAQETWTWLPEEEGEFVIVVRVSDSQETMEGEMPFRIIR
jgi:outer membrane protein assembly factor BamB